jgi:polysaccharide export outer membrane protein
VKVVFVALWTASNPLQEVGLSLPKWRRRKVSATARIGVALVGALAVMLSACALPAAGPTSDQVEYPFDGPTFTLVKIDSRIVQILRKYAVLSFGPRFRRKHSAVGYALRPGDAIAISVYETGGASLFGTTGPSVPGVNSATTPATGVTPAGITTVPPQFIESDGTITMPFVGRVQAAGKSPGQLAQEIEKQLKGKAVEPQVIISLTNGGGNLATVGGEVAQPRQVPLTMRGERLLDVIAQAGGAKFPPYESYVRVIRDGVVGTVLLQTAIASPSENIFIQPNDQIFVVRNPRTFTVMGASQKPSQYTFDTEKVSLVEGVARAGGPIDQIGDPTGIYLFRYEPWEIARAIWQVPPPEVYSGGRPPDFVPILYRVGFTGAGGVFLGQSILLRDKDVILITNAGATQLQKSLAVVRGFTGIAFDLNRNFGN